jgi:hypothetical protein
MSTTTDTPPTAGKAIVLATYEFDEGERQRVDGIPRITDRPTSQGRSYLVEENITTMAELQALLDDYQAKAKRLGYAPMQGWS